MKPNRIIHSLFSTLIIMCLATCTKKSPVLAKVGSYTITKEDAERRDAIIKVYYPQDERKLGLNQLMGAFTMAQVLINNGHPIDEKTLEEEAKRIDASTLMPEMLIKIKNIFTKEGRFDRASYIKNYILPVYVERVIYYEFFFNKKEFHTKSLSRAENLFQKSRNAPKAFSEIAKADQLKTQRLKIANGEVEWVLEKSKLKNKIAPGMNTPQMPIEIQQKLAEQKNSKNSEEVEFWLKLLTKLKPQEFFPEIINYKEHWLILKLLAYTEKPKDSPLPQAEIEILTIPKDEYGPWYENEAAKVGATLLMKRNH